MDSLLSPEKRAKLLIDEMTQEEKLTLVFGYYGSDADWKGYEAPEGARIGSAGFVPGIARLGIPPQWQTDASLGVATQGNSPEKRERTALPSSLAAAATFDPDLCQRAGRMIGAEARASGFNVMLAGGVNLAREAAGGRNFEYAGEDPLLAGTTAGALIAGIESNDIISTVKHFAFNNQETDRKHGNVVIGDAAARSSDLLAFEFAIERGSPGAVMCAYNQVNGVPSCESHYLLTEVLRKDWDYKGYVMSDWGAVHSTVKAANAGLDQQSGWPFDEVPYFGAPLKKAIAEGKVSQARLDEMVYRILRAMFARKLFDKPVRKESIDYNAHAKVTRAVAEQGAVLLKNVDNLLPLSSKLESIAVIGGHADQGVLSGGGSSQVYPVGGNAVPGISPTSWPGPVVYYPSSPLEGIKRRAPEAKVQFAGDQEVQTAVELAQKSDVAIVFLTQWTTESIDPSLVLPREQDALVAAVAQANPQTVVVLETGGAVLTPWAHQVPAIVETWFPGTAGGEATSRLLFGEVNPSGHLPISFPKNPQQLPRDGKPRAGEVRYTEGAAVGYKWFDKNDLQPQFPFGHGLSYTDFSLQGLRTKGTVDDLHACFTIKNTGTRPGSETAQIYVAGDVFEAPQRLGAFKKVGLQPGQSTNPCLKIDPRLLATWNTKSQRWQIAAGMYEIRLGYSSREIAETAAVQLPESTLPPSRSNRVLPDARDAHQGGR